MNICFFQNKHVWSVIDILLRFVQDSFIALRITLFIFVILRRIL